MDKPHIHRPQAHPYSGYAITDSCLRLSAPGDRIAGSAVAVTPRLAVTCTHVLLDALEPGRSLDNGIRFKVTAWQAAEPRTHEMRLLPGWLPVQSGDIALLELLCDTPELTPACIQLNRGDQWQGQPAGVLGFPNNFDHGQWADLRCQNAIHDGQIQCNPEKQGISQGYSGGPVFCTHGNLLGIARACCRLKSAGLKFDYIIPIERIAPLFEGPQRQPYFALASSLERESALAPELLHEVRKTPPHTLREYRLQRLVRDWETRDVGLHFTPLSMLLEERRRDTLNGTGPAPVTLHDLDSALKDYPQHPVFLLKGSPGSGKSTLLKRLAFDINSGRSSKQLLPVLVELGNHTGGASPGEWLARQWGEQFARMPSLEEILGTEEVLWLLDGLNELPDEVNHAKSDKIRAWGRWLANQVPRHRAVISCRSADYLDELDEIDVYVVPHLELQPMDLKKIGEFLSNRLPQRQARDAVEHIRSRELTRLYNTPLMLTLLEEVLTPGGDFPYGRAGLFSAYLCRLIAREGLHYSRRINSLFREQELKRIREAARCLTDEENRRGFRNRLICRPNPLFDALSEQAYQRQRAEFQGERQEVSFDCLELEDALHDSCGKEQGELILQTATALNLLIMTEDGRHYRFRHQQFQEFFAARKMAGTGEFSLAAAPHEAEGFRKPLELVRSEMKPWQQLPEVDRSGWEETLLMAAELARDEDGFITGLAEANLPLAGRCAAHAPAITGYSALAEQLLARMRDAGSDMRARIAAGKALGEMGALEVLGYRAHRDRRGKLIAWLPPTEAIAAGRYTFGSQDDSLAYDNESRFTQELDAFRLGRYPVTNAEWACFMDAGGYENDGYWQGEVERNYRQSGSNEGVVQAWKWWRDRYEAHELDERLEASSLDLDMRDLVRRKVALEKADWKAHLAELRGNSSAVEEPFYWRTSRYNNPLQPVVGISLFESLAYCRWLGEVSGEYHTLPNELQWEAAARGKGGSPRLYAWGDEFRPDYCNSRDAQDRIQVGAPTPVGLYGQGRTPDCNLYDMTGNVWEWTSSAWRDRRPYDTALLEQIDNAEQSRVVRGGAWDDIQRYARAACRLDNTPDRRNNALGCRVCVLPPLES